MSKGDEKAREKLILHNLRLVAHIIKKYYSAVKEQDDLISIGTIGLIKAIDSFNAEKGARFATYAGKCIQNEILMHFRSQKKLANETSMNDSIDVDKDGNPLTYMEILSEDDNVLETVDRSIKISVMSRAIENALDKRERQIIEKRYGLRGGGELPQREVAKQLGISRSYVSRIEKTALEKIEAYMRCRGIDEE
jgi:RNA polymerase sporulation-specific sigma factor